MQKFLRRAVWSSAWGVTYAILAYLCVELADSQPVILALLLLAAFVASVGPVYARQSFLGGDWSVGMATLAVSVISLAVSLIGDTSYWSGTLETVHEQVLRDRAINDGQNLVIARQKERYSALSNGQSADRLQAEMAAALAKPIAGKALGARTGNCTDTASPHYQACRSYFDLKAQFAAASEAQKLESVVWSAGTNVEKPGRRRDFYRAAVVISEITGWSVENSIYAITAVIVTLLQVLLMLSLYCGASPSRKEASGRAKAPKATETAPLISSPVQHRVERLELTPRVDLSRKVIAETPPQPPKPDDTPPPGDVKPVEEVVTDASKNSPVHAGPVLVGPDWKPAPKLSNKQRTALRKRRMREEVIEAVNEFATERLDTKSKAAKFVRTSANFVQEGGTPGVKIRKAFRTWAETSPKWSHLATYKDSPLGEIMCAVFKNGRPSKGGGAYYGAVLRKKAALVAA